MAILSEVDSLVGAHLGAKAQDVCLDDLASGAFQIEWGTETDLTRAQEIARRHRALRIGLVDAVVMVTAERLRRTRSRPSSSGTSAPSQSEEHHSAFPATCDSPAQNENG